MDQQGLPTSSSSTPEPSFAERYMRTTKGRLEEARNRVQQALSSPAAFTPEKCRQTAEYLLALDDFLRSKEDYMDGLADQFQKEFQTFIQEPLDNG